MATTRCPSCGSSRIFRDRYMGTTEWLRITPFRPYGCRECHRHFIGWRKQVPFVVGLERQLMRTVLVFAASCPNCRARELERSNPASLRGSVGRALARWLHFPAYRCSKCGKKFFKFRWHIRYSRKLAGRETP